MAPNSSLLADIVLPISSSKFLQLFWLNKDWYYSFLTDKLKDMHVEMSDWKRVEGSDERSKFSWLVKSFHPSHVSFPGLPSHAESNKTQSYEVVDGSGENLSIVIVESDVLKGIPYADYFSVQTDWKILPKYNSSSPNSSVAHCQLIIQVSFIFHKSTWLQGTIESNSKAELLRINEIWLENAMALIKQQDVSAERMEEGNSSRAHAPLQSANYHIDSVESVLRLSSHSLHGSTDDVDHDMIYAHDSNDNYSSDDDNFYDAEESFAVTNSQSNKVRSRSNSKTLLLRLQSTASHASNISNSSTYLQYDDAHDGEDDDSISLDHPNLSPMTTRDMAIAIVEASFVFAEYFFWAVYRLYMYDLKELFNVRPHEFYAKVIASFIPGRHRIILKSPDLFGSTIAVFLLPQVLLLSMELSRHGCSQSALLGNTVVISLCIWLGLSALYRLLAYLVSPWMEIKHCCCIVGYSFFSWNMALLISYPLELYYDIIKLSPSLPLILLGIPAAIAQGYIFWEYIPLASITLRPNSLHRSIQGCAQANSAWIQRLLWSIPKIAVFIVISGTHYQLLWYISRTLLPGTQQQCRLSALVQPSRYADILTQKELLRFASHVLDKDSGNKQEVATELNLDHM